MGEMKTEEYDLIVIGAGPGGTPTAMEYATLHPTKRVLLIDKKGELGGECLFDGCIPSKILAVAAEQITNLKKSPQLGVAVTLKKTRVLWKTIVERKKSILQGRATAAKEKLLSLGNVKLVKGTARFNNTTSIILTTAHGSQEISFKKAVIATGSQAFIPPVKGNGLKKVWTNDIFFDLMELPEELSIIGDGPIGIEFSQILAQLGVKITLFGNKNRILPMIDETFAALLLKKIQNHPNITLHLEADVEEITFDKKFTVLYKQQNTQKKIRSSHVLFATGRTPVIEELDLDKANVRYEKKGINVNASLLTTNKNIYAVGDVALGFPRFAHTASYGAHIIAQNLFFGKDKVVVDYDKNAWVLFSEPNIVTAGITEDEAKRRGIDVHTKMYDYGIDAKAQIGDADAGYLKYIVEKKTLRIIGIQIITENAHMNAGEAALIVANKLTIKNLVDTIHPHPTLSESFTFLAKLMMAEIMTERMRSPLFKIGFFIKKWL